MTDTNKASNPKHEKATPRPGENKSLDGITNFHPAINRPGESGGQAQGGGAGQTAKAAALAPAVAQKSRPPAPRSNSAGSGPRPRQRRPTRSSVSRNGAPADAG